MLRLLKRPVFAIVSMSGLMVFPPTKLSADPVWGFISDVGVSSSNGLSAFPPQLVMFGGNNPVMVTSYASPHLYASGTNTSVGGSVSGSALAWASGTGPILHGYASASEQENCNCGPATISQGVFDIVWYDTLTISGVPDGSPVNLVLTGVLDSKVSGNDATVEATFDLGYGSFVLIDNSPGSTSSGGNGSDSGTVLVQAQAGQSILLSVAVEGIANAIDFTGTGSSAFADASNTAKTYIDIITPGATLESASGLSYDSSPVPEPSTWGAVLMSLGSGFIACRKLSRGRHRRNN